MKLNNKGFSLVEILAVIAILAILMGTAITAYTKYIKKTSDKAIDTLAKSAAQAGIQYKMDNQFAYSVTFKTLYEKSLISSIKAPGKSNSNCIGKVSFFDSDKDDNEKILTSYDKIRVCMKCNDQTYYYSYLNDGNEVKTHRVAIEYDLGKEWCKNLE